MCTLFLLKYPKSKQKYIRNYIIHIINTHFASRFKLNECEFKLNFLQIRFNFELNIPTLYFYYVLTYILAELCYRYVI